jgi:hypothetical protein
VSSVRRHHRLLATFFNFEINRLADRFLMEIEENVNPGKETGQFSKIPFENRKNMQSHIVACDSRDRNSKPIIYDYYVWALKQKGRP